MRSTAAPVTGSGVASGYLRSVGSLDRRIVLRVPGASATAGDAVLADVNRTAREHARRRLAVRFPDLDLAATAQATDGVAFQVGRVDTTWLQELDGAGHLDEILARHDTAHPRLDFARGGVTEHLPAPDGVLVPSEQPYFVTRSLAGPLSGALVDGYSAIVNSADQYGDATDELCEDLERVFGTRVNVNAYFSVGDAPGFGSHWDDHDVLILQLVGRKYWVITEPPALSPLRPFVPEDTTSRVVWEGVVEPGMVLAIPRGWGHEVQGHDEMSLHFTIGVARLHGVAVAKALASLSGRHAAARVDVVPPLDGAVGPEMLEAVRSVAEAALDPASFDHVCAYHRALTPARHRTRLSLTFDAVAHEHLDGTWLRWPLSGGVLLADELDAGPDDDSIVLVCDRRLLRIDPRALDVVAALAVAEPVPFDSLPGLDDDERCADTRSFVRDLVAAGFVDVVPDPDHRRRSMT